MQDDWQITGRYHECASWQIVIMMGSYHGDQLEQGCTFEWLSMMARKGLSEECISILQ